MGAFFGSVYARGADRARVLGALEAVSKKSRCCFLVAPEIRGWTAIYPSEHGQDEKISREIHLRLKAEVLHVMVHDSDIFYYAYYRDGRLVDEYSSRPDYFGKVSARKRDSLRGRPEELRGLLRKPGDVEALRELLASHDSEDAFFAHTMLERFAALLDLPNSATSYEYLTGDEEDEEVERRDEFVHVPSLAPEKAKRSSARAKAATELDRLRREGLVLFEQSPAPVSFCPDPAGRAFLMLDEDPMGRKRPLYRLAEPWPSEPSPTGVVLGARRISLSPSGRYLAAAASGGGVELWDLEEKRPLFEVPHSRTAALAGFTPDEKVLITAADAIRLTSAPEGNPIRSFPVTPYGACALHPSGSALIARMGRVKLQVIDLAEGSKLKTFLLEGFGDLGLAQKLEVAFMTQLAQHARSRLAEHTGAPVDLGLDFSLTAEAPESLLFSADGRYLFCGTNKGAWVFEWEAVLGSGEGQPRPVHRIRIAKKASGMADLMFSQIDLSGSVFDLAHDAAENRLLLACGDGNVRQIDLATGSASVLVAMPGGHAVSRALLSSDGALLCTIERPAIGDLQREALAMLPGGDRLAASVPEDQPDRLLIWDYRKLWPA